MAKGVEDSAMYVYNRLISMNEVGGIPDARVARSIARLSEAAELTMAAHHERDVHARHQTQR